MRIYQKKIYIGVVLLTGIIFSCLLLIRLGLFRSLPSLPASGLSGISDFPHELESWMSIFQQEEKIGYLHKTMHRTSTGFYITENAYMRINTMGFIQDINMSLAGDLNSDFSAADFHFKLESGPFVFAVDGEVKDDMIVISSSQADGYMAKMEIPVSDKPYLFAGIPPAIKLSGLRPGESYVFFAVDPTTMSHQPVEARFINREKIVIMGEEVEAAKISFSFKGLVQEAWLDERGDVLMEKGLLGMRMEKTTKEKALSGIVLKPAQDITEAASVPANVIIPQPDKLNLMEVEIQGIDSSFLSLHGGRQHLDGNILTIRKETLPRHDEVLVAAEIIDPQYLQPTLHIRSDHPQIMQTAAQIINSETNALIQAQSLADWIYHNIEKKPVLSVPDAISTLNNLVGDCNEHAILLAAFARAVGIPAQMETGLVYLRGRFYYHAWNVLYVGEWITVDSLFGQFPADVTHIRLSSGFTEQTDLLGVIGNINLTILRTE